jgi:hypothetical protein
MKRQIQHFKAAMAQFNQIRAALALTTPLERDAAMAKVRPLVHRGKGKGVNAKRHNAAAGRSRYSPHQGERECERRRVGGFAYARRKKLQ